MSYSELVQADRRLLILRALSETNGYGANRRLIQQFLDSEGHIVSRDLVDAEIAWLAEVGLVTVRDDAVLLSERGGDVAVGRATVPGVRRPTPGE
ncbi:ArsR family transcriptional regulator [Burkholderia cenocepacia]|uniref:VpaChn25_0724 family phage protein n=1 Tax=Burkholderia cenocepacia TaxID=95486 RepID=UPI001AA0B85F|nr:ArsR family transcriptional regulator [Burkholderia cenocepacia]MBO1856814.1 ArsR family transcriptional regulator [Burkholderia cenocepacia]